MPDERIEPAHLLDEKPKLKPKLKADKAAGIINVDAITTLSGIPPEALSKVFDPFFSTFGGGTGLGLAVCHRIIVAHGGLLFIESQRGRGTTVHLRLAAASPT